jgi:phosphatidylinositol-3-phosphatase
VKQIISTAIALVMLVPAAGCRVPGINGDAPSGPQQSSYLSAPRLHHVFIIVLENREYGAAGEPPYLRSLQKAGASATRYYALGHPSLPNYLALLSGSTQGVTGDDFSGVLSARTLVDQLEAAGLTWKAYMEDLPSPCFLGDQAGEYARKHDPFTYFSSIRDNPKRCALIQPLPALMHDLQYGPVPNFVWITPNLCHDGHDCGSAQVDAFLRSVVPNITASLAYRDHGALFITYDEGTLNTGCCGGAAGGQVESLVLGPGIRAGSTINFPTDHYSILRTIEDGFGLRHLAHASCRCTSTLGKAWKS